MEQAITDAEFGRFRELMRRVAGVTLAPTKKQLVCGRLGRRLQAYGLRSFADYYRLVVGGGAPDEFERMVDLLTTHETYFFREPRHFDYLAATVLPQCSSATEFRAWSAASSSGEEAYSLAMVLMDRLGEHSGWTVFGSDISQEVLRKAAAGIYATNRIGGIPDDYLRRFCLRGIGARTGTLRIDAALRRRVRFAAVNLMHDALAGLGPFDVIFLRNVLIYFDVPAKRQIVRRVLGRLKPGGWLFIGHAETLGTLGDVGTALRQEHPTVYRKS